MTEIWKDIPGLNYYQASNLGNIKSLPKMVNNNLTKVPYLMKGRILVQMNTTTGYKRVSVIDGNEKKQISVHRLVAMAFLDNPDNKRTVNHKNGIKYDNRIENLEWATYSENTSHAIKNGLKIPGSGSTWHRSKVDELQVIVIRKLRDIVLQRELARYFNINRTTVSFIQSRKSWNQVR